MDICARIFLSIVVNTVETVASLYEHSGCSQFFYKRGIHKEREETEKLLIKASKYKYLGVVMSFFIKNAWC